MHATLKQVGLLYKLYSYDPVLSQSSDILGAASKNLRRVGGEGGSSCDLAMAFDDLDDGVSMAYEGLVDVVDAFASIPILLSAYSTNGPQSPRCLSRFLSFSLSRTLSFIPLFSLLGAPHTSSLSLPVHTHYPHSSLAHCFSRACLSDFE